MLLRQPATLSPVFRVREPVTLPALPVPAQLFKVYTRCVVLSNINRSRRHSVGAFLAHVVTKIAYGHPQPPMTQYPPRHVQQVLNVSGSTVRRWSDEFARHLSPSATSAPRRYSDQDLAALRRIKSLLDAGLRIDDVDQRLDEPEPLPPTETPVEPPEAPTMALQTVTALLDTLKAQQTTLEAQQTTLAGLADLANFRERLARLETVVETLQRDLAVQGEVLRRDVDAHGRLLESLSQRLNDHEGVIGSVGDKAHGHKPGLGRALSGFES